MLHMKYEVYRRQDDEIVLCIAYTMFYQDALNVVTKLDAGYIMDEHGKIVYRKNM